MVGFLVAFADVSRGLQRAKGRLFPFGILHILAAMRRTRQLDLMLGGIRADCRGAGINALLALTMLRSVKPRVFLNTVFHCSHIMRRSTAESRCG